MRNRTKQLAAYAFGVGSLLACAAVSAAAAPARTSVERIRAGVLQAKAEPVADNRVRLALTPPRDAVGGDAKLFDDAGREIAVDVGAAGALEAVVDPHRSYVLARGAVQRRALPDDGAEFPARYVSITPQGVPRLGGLFLRPARVPLTWSEAVRAYTTDLFVGYEFTDDAERPLAQPKTVRFFAEGSHARIQADTVIVRNSGVAGYQRVTLFTSQVDGETLFTARAGANDELRSSVSVQREPGGLKLSLAPREIGAFGVETAKLALTLLARDGLPLSPAAPVEFQLSSRRLRQPASVTLPIGKSSVEVSLRSAGYGADEVTVRGAGLEASQPVRLVFPLWSIVGALAGGALGGGLRYLRNKSRRPALLWRRLAEGVLVGVVIVAAVWAGVVAVELNVDVLGTPLGAFIVAALAGYLGCSLVDRVAARAFGAAKPA